MRTARATPISTSSSPSSSTTSTTGSACITRSSEISAARVAPSSTWLQTARSAVRDGRRAAITASRGSRWGRRSGWGRATCSSAASSSRTTAPGRWPSGFGRRVAWRGIRGIATPTRFSVLGMAYRNRWNATDQIPQRAVDGGQVARFGHRGWHRWRQHAALQSLGLVESRREPVDAERATVRHLLRPQSVLELHVLPRRSRARRPVQSARAARRRRRQRPPHAAGPSRSASITR